MLGGSMKYFSLVPRLNTGHDSPLKQRELLGQRVTISSPRNIQRKHELCFSSHLVFCSLQLWWWADLQVGGATRLLQPWLSASCPPAAALQSSAGPSTKGAWPAPRARRRSVPPSSPACIAPGSRRRLTMAIITRPQMPTSRTTTKSTAKRRTSSRRRRKEVGLRLSACLWICAHLTCRDEWTLSPSCLPGHQRWQVPVVSVLAADVTRITYIVTG